MSIVGITIDYGPYGFMDTFDPAFICNGSGKHNLKKIGESFTSVEERQQNYTFSRGSAMQQKCQHLCMNFVQYYVITCVLRKMYWLDNFCLNWSGVCYILVDNGGRYSYENQPSICRWNCKKLGEAIQMSLPVEKSEASLKVFDDEYDRAYLQGMRNKV